MPSELKPSMEMIAQTQIKKGKYFLANEKNEKKME